MKDHVEGCKLADDFTSLCKNAVGYMKTMEEYNPALMNAVRQYLKDNNVTVDNRTGTPMNELANEFDKMLPFPDEETQQKQKQL